MLKALPATGKEIVSDTVDIEKPRRNLLVVSCVLIFIELAGIKIAAINVPGLTVSVQRPELLIPFVWTIFAYSLWRFWLLARPHYAPFHKRANKFVNRCRHIKEAITAQGFEFSDNWFNDHHPELVRNMYRREARFYTQDSSGQVNVEKVVKLSYLKMLFPELLGDIRCLPQDRAFVEYSLPLFVAFVPVALVVIKALFHFFPSAV
jgi:hypothetical protein